MLRKQKAAPGFKGHRGGFVPALRRRSAHSPGLGIVRIADVWRSAAGELVGSLGGVWDHQGFIR
jgi:hypothetical protein